jgi:hypothetical protein
MAARSSGVHIENKSRIFKVLKTSHPTRRHPVEVQGILGYEFFQRDPETHCFLEFNRVLGRDVEHKFWAKLKISHLISAFCSNCFGTDQLHHRLQCPPRA